MQAVYSALRQGYIYILSRVDRLAALKGAAEPRKRRLKAQWFYMSKIIYLFIYLVGANTIEQDKPRGTDGRVTTGCPIEL